MGRNIPECAINQISLVSSATRKVIMRQECNSQVQRPGIICFKCGKPCHFSRECKEPTQTTNVLRITGPPTQPSAPQARARTFNMTRKEAVQDVDVISGTLSINSVEAKVLIDSGATKSFISQEFVDKLQCRIQPLEQTLVIEVANQAKIPVSQVCPKCDVEIENCHFIANLIPFKLGEFDVILGMDWLFDHEAQIDCKKKKLKVKTAEGKEVEF